MIGESRPYSIWPYKLLSAPLKWGSLLRKGGQRVGNLKVLASKDQWLTAACYARPCVLQNASQIPSHLKQKETRENISQVTLTMPQWLAAGQPPRLQFQGVVRKVESCRVLNLQTNTPQRRKGKHILKIAEHSLKMM